LQGSGDLGLYGPGSSAFADPFKKPSPVQITEGSCAVEKEPLIRPLGINRLSLTVLWQTVEQLNSEKESFGIGLGTQSVLWSDVTVFLGNSETEGNSQMYALTKRAVQMLKGHSFVDPISLTDEILDEVYSPDVL